MKTKNRRVDPGIESDPFGEGAPRLVRRPVNLMGGRFQFESSSEELLALVDAAYAGLPGHRFSPRPKTFRVKLMQTAARPRSVRGSGRREEPPCTSMLAGAGFLGSAIPASTFVVLSAKERTGLVSVFSAR